MSAEIDRDKFIEEHKTTVSDSDLTVFPKPKKGCPRCQTRGFEGAISNQYAYRDIDLCRCIKNRIGREGVECLTYGEFNKILAHFNSIFNKGDTHEVVTQIIQGAAEGNTPERDESTAGYSSTDS